MFFYFKFSGVTFKLDKALNEMIDYLVKDLGIGNRLGLTLFFYFIAFYYSLFTPIRSIIIVDTGSAITKSIDDRVSRS